MLDEHGVVDIGAKCPFHGFQVRLVPICGQLHSTGHAGCNILRSLKSILLLTGWSSME